MDVTSEAFKFCVETVTAQRTEGIKHNVTRVDLKSITKIQTAIPSEPRLMSDINTRSNAENHTLMKHLCVSCRKNITHTVSWLPGWSGFT